MLSSFRWLAGLLCLAAAGLAERPYAIVQSETCDLKAEASSSSKILGTLKRGDKVGLLLTIRVEGELWCQLADFNTNAEIGYAPCVQMKLVMEKPVPTTPVPPEPEPGAKPAPEEPEAPEVATVTPEAERLELDWAHALSRIRSCPALRGKAPEHLVDFLEGGGCVKALVREEAGHRLTASQRSALQSTAVRTHMEDCYRRQVEIYQAHGLVDVGEKLPATLASESGKALEEITQDSACADRYLAFYDSALRLLAPTLSRRMNQFEAWDRQRERSQKLRDRRYR